MKKMMRCITCGSYTLSDLHCGNRTVSAHPPIFNPSDPYGKYRRMSRGVLQ